MSLLVVLVSVLLFLGASVAPLSETYYLKKDIHVGNVQDRRLCSLASPHREIKLEDKTTWSSDDEIFLNVECVPESIWLDNFPPFDIVGDYLYFLTAGEILKNAVNMLIPPSYELPEIFEPTDEIDMTDGENRSDDIPVVEEKVEVEVELRNLAADRLVKLTVSYERDLDLFGVLKTGEFTPTRLEIVENEETTKLEGFSNDKVKVFKRRMKDVMFCGGALTSTGGRIELFAESSSDPKKKYGSVKYGRSYQDYILQKLCDGGHESKITPVDVVDRKCKKIGKKYKKAKASKKKFASSWSRQLKK